MTGDEYDVIVIGSGAAGLAAACTAAALGCQVLVLERSDRVGGTTAISGGMVWVPNNRKMAALGLQDSPDQAWTYLRQAVPGCEHDPRMRAYLEHGDDAIAFLESHTSLRLQPVRRYPDYYPALAGATAGGRVLEPVPFDGRELGADFARLRDPLPEFLLFGGMMVSREDLPVLRRVDRSPAALWHAARLLARYAGQRLTAHRGTTLVLGNALAARMFKSACDLHVRFALGAVVQRLTRSSSRITGVEIREGASARVLRARRAVILATGGISHHPDLRAQYTPAIAGNRSATVDPKADCSGVHLARDAGATLSAPVRAVDDALAFWVPVSEFRRADGSAAMFPHTVTDRAKPGLIAVGGDGRRFVNEAVSYHEFVRAQLREPAQRIPAWLVCDSRFLWRYGLGRVRPFALSTRQARAEGYLYSAGTVEALASSIGVPAAALADTVRGYNRAAADGQDAAFGRGGDIYQRHLGDADWRPNPCVAPILQAPFHAVAVRPADLGCAAGVVTDAEARALGADGRPIEGLYACGNDMHSVMQGRYPAPGITLGPALVFGYLAGRSASLRPQP